MRLFLAIDLDEAARRALAAEHERLAQLIRGSSLKFVKPEQLHVTLVFLGEVAPDRATAVRAAIEVPLEGAPFDAVYDTWGTFPPRGAPRVLWIGASTGAAEMVALQQQLAARAAALGIEIERRAFHPHLTLGRWRESRPRDREAVLQLPRLRPGVPTFVNGVTLYHSRLSPAGATYTPLARATLESSS